MKMISVPRPISGVRCDGGLDVARLVPRRE